MWRAFRKMRELLVRHPLYLQTVVMLNHSCLSRNFLWSRSHELHNADWSYMLSLYEPETILVIYIVRTPFY
jgi:hypothetical protein